MSKFRPIPTPLEYRWRRFLQQGLPAVTFFVVAMLALWLWDRQASMGNAVGTVEAPRIDIPASVDGLVQVPPRGNWNRFDTVQANETVAMIANFDDSLSQAKLETIRKQVSLVKSNMAAEQVKFAFDVKLRDSGSDIDRIRQAYQIDLRIEELRLEVLDQQTLLAAAQQEFKRLDANQRFLDGAGPSVPRQEATANRLRRSEVAARMREMKKAIDERKTQLKVEWNRRNSTKELLGGRVTEVQDAIKAIIAPFRDEISVLNAQMGEVETEFNALEVKAPISGEITLIHAYPGQAVQAGDPLITIAQDTGRYIVSYIRPNQRIRVEPAMEVRVREKREGARPIRAVIADVGPQVEAVPLQHLRDPNQPEWGLPVTIELPPELNVRPGELIDIIFSSRTVRRNDT